MSDWRRQRLDKRARLAAASSLVDGKIAPAKDAVRLLEAVVRPGDRVCLEGDNQKQATFLAKSLAAVNPDHVHGLNLLISTISLPEHLDLFESGIAAKVDFSYCGRQAGRLARMIDEKRVNIGAVHTYLELYARYFIDLTPNVCLLCADAADREGNLFLGFNAEDTPTIVEATAFKDGVVIVQANRVVDALPRVDVPGDWVDFVIESPAPYAMDALFTRDPASLNETRVLIGMMCIKGIYAEYGVNRLNHGVGFNTAAIELLLPTYAAELGLKGKICQHWVLNPHPTMIPAIEAGFVKSIHCPGGEIGMEDYVKSRPDIFFTGADGALRSNRAFSHMAGHYALDMFIGSTLQIDVRGDSSTATLDRLTGFGGAPNLGCDNRGRRHNTPALLKAGKDSARPGAAPRGRKLVVQAVETFQGVGAPTFVETLDAVAMGEKLGWEVPPIMIYGDDVTHVVTEEGIANLTLCATPEEREQAIRGVAGYTPVGMARDHRAVENLRDRGAVRRPEDLGVRLSDATVDLLAARSIKDLVVRSGGLYKPPKQFIDW